MSTELIPAEGYPWLKFEIHSDQNAQQFIADPQDLYILVAAGIKKQLGGGGIDPNASEDEKTLTRVVRTAVKGALLAFGGKMLQMMFKSPNHPKPAKGDDLIEWYSNMFAQIIIAEATKGMLILHAKEGGEPGAPIFIDEICPITNASGATGNDRGTIEGTALSIESSSATSPD